MQKLRNLIIAILLITGVGALGYWNVRPESFMHSGTNHSAPNPEQIDFFVDQAHTLQFQDDGQLNYELSTERLEHVQQTDISYAQAPQMKIYRNTPQPWTIESARAEIAPQGAEIELIDAVQVQRHDAQNRPSTLTTTRLTLFPDKEYAQTQQAVRITAANGVTTAQGMKAYLNEGRMILQSNVRGQYAAE